MDKSILITGSNGFIGKKFLEKLIKKKADRIYTLERNGLFYIKDGKKVITQVSKKVINQVNHIYHFATKYNPSPNEEEKKEIFESNFTFGKEFLENFLNRKDEIRLTFFSSYFQLTKSKSNCTYTLSKKLFSEWCHKSFKNIREIYLFDTYGSNDKRNKFLSILIKAAMDGEPIKIPNNKIELNYIDADEIVDLLVNERFIKGVFSIKANTTYTIEELIQKVEKISEKKINVKKIGKSINLIKEIEKFPPSLSKRKSNYSIDCFIKQNLERNE